MRKRESCEVAVANDVAPFKRRAGANDVNGRALPLVVALVVALSFIVLLAASVLRRQPAQPGRRAEPCRKGSSGAGSGT